MKIQEFDLAAEVVKENAKLVDKLEKNQKLSLYANFKQANAGDNETKKPGMLDLKGKAKWEAWNKVKGID